MRTLIIFLIGLTVGMTQSHLACCDPAIGDTLVGELIDHQQKIRSLLWLEIEQLDEIQNFPEQQSYYLNEDSEYGMAPGSQGLSFARQLDHRMNPSKDYDLPDLSFLASINDRELTNGYYEFLRKIGTALNYRYLVLPQTNNPREQVVVNDLQLFDPDYFILPSRLQFGIPDKKKEIKTLFEGSDFWLVGQDELPEALKRIRKYEHKIFVEHDHLVQQSNVLNTPKNNKPTGLDPVLAVEMKKAAVALIEKESILPINADTICFITNDPYGPFANMLRNYTYVITEAEDILDSKALILADYNPVLHELYSQRTKVYVGSIEGFDSSFFDAGLIASGKDGAYEYILPQQLFGAASITGSISSAYHLLDQFEEKKISSIDKLGFVPATTVGLKQYHLDSISKIIDEGILAKAFPGCQLAVAIDGSVVINRHYGYLTYENLIPVYPSTIFDLASITKVAATSMMAMKLFEDHQLDLDQTVGYYLPWYIDSNKKDITIKSLMAHQAGLLPYVPFWKRILSGDFLEPFYYESIYDEVLDQRSYRDLEPTSTMKDSLTLWIRNSSLLRYDSVPYYSYSDIGFMILQQVLEEIACMPMDKYLDQHFYIPLGLRKTLFNPRKYSMDLFEIAPTEYDSYYRSEQIWGEVHDRNAAILDGVAGHAGLFSNAMDLLTLFQMTLQGGKYGGESFFSQETLDVFNKQYFPDNRRGLGWDKKSTTVNNVSDYASEESFGHTGFTGTMVWADPKYDLVFVFLSNRIHPNVNNRKLNELDIRTRIQDIVYKAIISTAD